MRGRVSLLLCSIMTCSNFSVCYPQGRPIDRAVSGCTRGACKWKKARGRGKRRTNAALSPSDPTQKRLRPGEKDSDDESDEESEYKGEGDDEGDRKSTV